MSRPSSERRASRTRAAPRLSSSDLATPISRPSLSPDPRAEAPRNGHGTTSQRGSASYAASKAKRRPSVHEKMILKIAGIEASIATRESSATRASAPAAVAVAAMMEHERADRLAPGGKKSTKSKTPVKSATSRKHAKKSVAQVEATSVRQEERASEAPNKVQVVDDATEYEEERAELGAAAPGASAAQPPNSRSAAAAPARRVVARRAAPPLYSPVALAASHARAMDLYAVLRATYADGELPFLIDAVQSAATGDLAAMAYLEEAVLEKHLSTAVAQARRGGSMGVAVSASRLPLHFMRILLTI